MLAPSNLPSIEPKPGLALYNTVLPFISAPRLNAYHRKGDSELDVLTLYNWNLCLCESLYPSLQNLEIAFRNQLYEALSQQFGSYWMWNNPPLSITDDQDQINAAEQRLRNGNKTADPPRMVAELTFGFWTRLLDRRFERVLWPQMLTAVFPCIPTKLRNRSTISAHFEAIRRLRNRISHHEPIWREDLLAEYAKIVEAIGWLSPEIAQMTNGCDRFPKVHTAGFQAALRTNLEKQSLQLYVSSLLSKP